MPPGSGNEPFLVSIGSGSRPVIFRVAVGGIQLIEREPWARRLVAQSVGVSLTELKAPFSDSLIAEGDATHRYHLFHIAEAQGEAKIQPNAMN